MNVKKIQFLLNYLKIKKINGTSCFNNIKKLIFFIYNKSNIFNYINPMYNNTYFITIPTLEYYVSDVLDNENDVLPYLILDKIDKIRETYNKLQGKQRSI